LQAGQSVSDYPLEGFQQFSPALSQSFLSTSIKLAAALEKALADGKLLSVTFPQTEEGEDPVLRGLPTRIFLAGPAGFLGCRIPLSFQLHFPRLHPRFLKIFLAFR